MKSDKRNIDYDQLISKLKGVNPAAEHPMELTDKVMKQIDGLPEQTSLKVRVNLNEQQWQVFKRLRIVTSVAAALLLGILVLTERADGGKTYDSVLSYHPETIKEIQSKYNTMLHNSESLLSFSEIDLKSGFGMFEKYREVKRYRFTYREKLQKRAADLTFN